MAFILTSPLLAMGILFGVLAWRRARWARALDEGLEVDGWVVEFVPLTLGGGTTAISDEPGFRRRVARVMAPVVEFAPVPGDLERVTNPEGGQRKKHRVGDRVRVRFPRGAPGQAVVVGENHHLIATALGVISGAFLLSWLWLNR